MIIYNHLLQSLNSTRTGSTLNHAEGWTKGGKHLPRLWRKTWIYKYSWPLNNIGLNCEDPLADFSVKIQSALCISRPCIHGFNQLRNNNWISDPQLLIQMCLAYIHYAWRSTPNPGLVQGSAIIACALGKWAECFLIRPALGPDSTTEQGQGTWL